MRAIPTLKISVSGVRGVVGDSLTPVLLTRFAQAFGTTVGGGLVVIGRDPRASGEMVRQAVVAGLLSTGCRLVDLEVCPTPTVQLMVRRLEARGGVAVTASHNPPEWNALKFVGGDGLFLSAERGRELLDVYHQGEYLKVDGARMRPIEPRPDAIDLHVRAVLEALGPLPAASSRRPRVVLDACNGAGIGRRAAAARRAGRRDNRHRRHARRVVPAAGRAHAREPLGARRRRARARRRRGLRAGHGRRPPGGRHRDGRAGERGSTLLLAVSHVLAGTPGTVVTNLSTTHALDAVAAGAGCAVVRSKVGEAHVAGAMVRERAVIGGEGNGGVIYPRVNFARDSLVGMALVLHGLAAARRPISEVVAALPPVHMVKRQVPCPSDRVGGVLARLRREHAHDRVDARDGVKVWTADGWFLVRPSNTEPVVRLVTEAGSDAGAETLADAVAARIAGWLGDRLSGAGSHLR